MLTFIIVLLIVGLIAGAVARLLVPGKDSMGLAGTIGVGVVGSFVGGFLQNLIFFHTLTLFHPSGCQLPHTPSARTCWPARACEV